MTRPIHAIFVPVGGGGLIAGVAAYVKRLRPKTRIIGVEPVDADAMAQSLRAGRRVVLDHVGLFADGVAVRQVGKEPFRLAGRAVRRRGSLGRYGRDLRGHQGRVPRHAGGARARRCAPATFGNPGEGSNASSRLHRTGRSRLHVTGATRITRLVPGAELRPREPALDPTGGGRFGLRTFRRTRCRPSVLVSTALDPNHPCGTSSSVALLGHCVLPLRPHARVRAGSIARSGQAGRGRERESNGERRSDRRPPQAGRQHRGAVSARCPGGQRGDAGRDGQHRRHGSFRTGGKWRSPF
jgi:hypothetical protein